MNFKMKLIVFGLIVLLCYLYYKKPSNTTAKLSKELELKTKIMTGNIASHNELGDYYYSLAKDDADPVIIQALAEYNKAVKAGYIDALLPVAEIYQFCNIPRHNIPNKDLSYAIYLRLIKESPSAQVRVSANMRLTQLNQERTQEILRHRGARALPVNRPEVDLQEFNIEIPEERNIRPIPQALPQAQPNPQQQQGNNRNNVRPPRPPVRNDSQNVHDSSVQKTFANAVKQLKNVKRFNDYYIPNDKCFEEVKQYINENSTSDPDIRKKALAAMDIIQKEKTYLMGVNMNEDEVFSLVWNRIKMPANHNRINSLKESFIGQLAECMVGNHDHAYCATGRGTRLVSSLQKIDAQSEVFELKPKWAIKEEIANLAAYTRNKILSEATRKEREAYENPNVNHPDEKALQTKMENKIKSAIQSKANDDYVNSSILTKEELDLELKPMLDAI